MSPEIFQLLKQGGLVLTVNRRLARHIQKQFGEALLTQGVEVWETPKVASWSDWLSSLWQEIRHDQKQVLLEPHQVKALWDDVVKQSDNSDLLLNPSNTAAMVAKAYDLLKQWNLEFDIVADFDHPDVQAFHQWATEYQRRCQRRNWLDSHGQLALITNYIKSGRFQLPAQITWMGFDALTPQQKSLISVQQLAGSSVSEASMEQVSGHASRRACSDAIAELETAAAWVHQLLDQTDEGRIGIVIPDLAGLRNDVTRVFDEALCPEAMLKFSDDFNRPYNLSYGMPLSESPVIAAALQVLSLAKSPMELPVLGRLIQSPYVGGAESELGARALLDRQLRELGDARYSLKDVIRLASNERVRCPILAEHFNAVLEEKKNQKRRQFPSAWINSFRALLKASGWPGQRTPNSPEFQAIEVWNAFLSKYASLDIIVGEIDFSDAVARLKQMAADHAFQLKTPETRVQILGLLEAAGLDFDYLWVTGLHDEVWPAPPKPNPFLPMRLQRQEEMPHSSAERELLFAQELTQRLLSSAKEVVVSYPTRESDRDLRPSPLIVDLTEHASSISLTDKYRSQLYENRMVEQLVDWQAMPLDEGVKAHGGSGVFTDQAACPFRAYGRHRLGARQLSDVVSGLSPAQRGSILHRILEKFWLDLKGQEELLTLDETALQERVRKTVANVLSDEAQRQPHRFTERFTALEQDRLSQLISVWLDVERKRESFTIVSSEEKRTVQIGGIEVDIKADRIDRLDNDGREMIIDYKTADRKAKAWFDERPDEPQLPLYAVTHNRPVAALGFGKLRADGCGLEGVSDDVEVGKGITNLAQQRYADESEWGAQIDLWRKVLEKLAKDFRNGKAEVDPKEPNTTCSYCGLAALCRINEHSGLGLEQGDE